MEWDKYVSAEGVGAWGGVLTAGGWGGGNF